MNTPWLTTRLVSAPPIRVGTLRVTPHARVLTLKLPGRLAGLVWMRPGPVEVVWASGARQWVEVRDLTREALVGAWTLCAAAALGWWLVGRRARSAKE
jgi:hypothetical protein